MPSPARQAGGVADKYLYEKLIEQGVFTEAQAKEVGLIEVKEEEKEDDTVLPPPPPTPTDNYSQSDAVFVEDKTYTITITGKAILDSTENWGFPNSSFFSADSEWVTVMQKNNVGGNGTTEAK